MDTEFMLLCIPRKNGSRVEIRILMMVGVHNKMCPVRFEGILRTIIGVVIR